MVHAPAAAGFRVVSLVPSITELLFALGLDAHVVGRTGFCIHPRERVRALPKVGGTKDVDLGKLRALAPTHVIVNVDENRAPDVEAMRSFVPHVIVTHPNAPTDNAALYRLLGGIFGAPAQAAALCARLQAELDACAAARFVPERVLYLCWKDPWMTVAADTYIAATLAAVGWTVPHPAGGFAGAARYPTVDLEAEALRVDRVLLSSEPFPFTERHAAELRARYPRVAVQLVDAELTSWYGARAIDGLAQLRALRTRA
jgi:ABC-type Fe3+-hydroxamate transport system substrate-binding protein